MAKETVTVLGVDYEVLKDKTDADFQQFKDGSLDGFTDSTVKKIVIRKAVDDTQNMCDMKAYQKSVLRHEIIHAFLYESGLDSCSDWATNEEIVDWIAIQFPKLLASFKEVGV